MRELAVVVADLETARRTARLEEASMDVLSEEGTGSQTVPLLCREAL